MERCNVGNYEPYEWIAQIVLKIYYETPTHLRLIFYIESKTKTPAIGQQEIRMLLLVTQTSGTESVISRKRCSSTNSLQECIAPLDSSRHGFQVTDLVNEPA